MCHVYLNSQHFLLAAFISHFTGAQSWHTSTCSMTFLSEEWIWWSLSVFMTNTSKSWKFSSRSNYCRIVYCGNCFNNGQNEIIWCCELISLYSQSIHTCNGPFPPAEGELMWAAGGGEGEGQWLGWGNTDRKPARSCRLQVELAKHGFSQAFTTSAQDGSCEGKLPTKKSSEYTIL